jgi:hypothetical protein
LRLITIFAILSFFISFNAVSLPPGDEKTPLLRRCAYSKDLLADIDIIEESPPSPGLILTHLQAIQTILLVHDYDIQDQASTMDVFAELEANQDPNANLIAEMVIHIQSVGFHYPSDNFTMEFKKLLGILIRFAHAKNNARLAGCLNKTLEATNRPIPR